MKIVVILQINTDLIQTAATVTCTIFTIAQFIYTVCL